MFPGTCVFVAGGKKGYWDSEGGTPFGHGSVLNHDWVLKGGECIAQPVGARRKTTATLHVDPTMCYIVFSKVNYVSFRAIPGIGEGELRNPQSMMEENEATHCHQTADPAL